MILDELEQERCNKNPITINTKCTFAWPGLVEDPEGRGGSNPLTCEHASPSLQFHPSLLSLLPLFLPNLHFLLVVIAQTELFTKEMIRKHFCLARLPTHFTAWICFTYFSLMSFNLQMSLQLIYTLV